MSGEEASEPTTIQVMIFIYFSNRISATSSSYLNTEIREKVSVFKGTTSLWLKFLVRVKGHGKLKDEMKRENIRRGKSNQNQVMDGALAVTCCTCPFAMPSNKGALGASLCQPWSQTPKE